MYQCLKHPWLSDRVRRRRRKIMAALNEGEKLSDIYFLILSTGPQNQIDIIRGDYLGLPYYRNRSVVVAGIAEDRHSADLLLLRMTQSCVNHRYGGRIRSFLEDKIREEGYLE